MEKDVEVKVRSVSMPGGGERDEWQGREGLMPGRDDERRRREEKGAAEGRDGAREENSVGVREMDGMGDGDK